jgi:hypothetical protein
MKKTLLAIVLLRLCSNAVAAQWIQAAQSPSVIVSYDAESTKRLGEHMTAWFRFDYPNSLTLPNGKPFVRILSRDVMDCYEESMMQIEASHLDKDGNVVAQHGRSKVMDLAPGSLMQQVERVVCRR